MGSAPGDQVGRIIEAWRRERPDVDVSSIGIITPVVRLAALVTDHRAHVLAGHGLEQSHLDVLAALRRSGAPFRLTAGEPVPALPRHGRGHDPAGPGHGGARLRRARP